MVDWVVRAHACSRYEANALFGHEVDATLDYFLVQLHVGNAVHEKTANAISSLKYRYQMAGAVKLGGASKSSWTRADDGNLLAGSYRRRFGKNQSCLKSFVDDCLLNVLDCYWIIIDGKYARAFAWSGTDSTGKLREVVGLVQSGKSLPPVTSVDQIVPLWDQIINRTAGSCSAY